MVKETLEILETVNGEKMIQMATIISINVSESGGVP